MCCSFCQFESPWVGTATRYSPFSVLFFVPFVYSIQAQHDKPFVFLVGFAISIRMELIWFRLLWPWLWEVSILHQILNSLWSKFKSCRNVTQLITSKGYPCEQHTVQTEDGFLLSVQRIPYGRAGKQQYDKPQNIHANHSTFNSNPWSNHCDWQPKEVANWPFVVFC